MTAGVLAAAPAVAALELTEALPGFPGYREYALVAVDGTGLVFWLQSVDPEGPRFMALPAAAYFPDYAPVFPAAVRGELGLQEFTEASVYCLVTVPGGDIREATANLRAPLLVNPATSQARQVVLADGAHPIRRPLRR
jgi:flagellar assembly factor FliW